MSEKFIAGFKLLRNYEVAPASDVPKYAIRKTYLIITMEKKK